MKLNYIITLLFLANASAAFSDIEKKYSLSKAGITDAGKTGYVELIDNLKFPNKPLSIDRDIPGVPPLKLTFDLLNQQEKALFDLIVANGSDRNLVVTSSLIGGLYSVDIDYQTTPFIIGNEGTLIEQNNTQPQIGG